MITEHVIDSKKIDNTVFIAWVDDLIILSRGNPDDSWRIEPNEYYIILDSKRKTQSKSARLTSENFFYI